MRVNVLSHISKNGRVPLLAALSAIVLAAVLGSIITYAFVSRHRQAENCRAALQVRDAVAFIIKDARDQSRQFQTATRNSERFYGRALVKLRKVECLPH